MNKQHLRKQAQLALLFTTALSLAAADLSDWSALGRLHRGDRIGVVQSGMRTVEGRFATVSDTAIVLENGNTVSIAQPNVVRVYKQGMSRKKKMMIGAAAGLAAGATVAATLSQRLNNEGFFGGSNGGAAAGAAVAGGAGIGIAIGSLSGNGYQTIYQRQGGRN